MELSLYTAKLHNCVDRFDNLERTPPTLPTPFNPTTTLARKNYLIEGCRYNARQKCRQWIILDVRSIDGIFC